MDAFDDIAYSEEGQSGRDIFLAEFCDVVYYFEDADHEPVYEKLISIIAPELLSSSIVCLGGKGNVLKLAQRVNDIGKPRIFIVDKDFDDILDCVRTAEGLIYLDRFCLENYLLSFPAMLGVAIDRYSLRGTVVHRQCHDFESFFATILERYTELTRLFLVARKNRIEIQTTKMDASKFIGNSGLEDILPVDFILTYEADLLSAAGSKKATDWITSGPVVDSLKQSAFDGVSERSVMPHVYHHLCGKHLLAILKAYIRTIVGVNLGEISTPSLYMDLLGRIQCVPGVFEYLSGAIATSVRAQGASRPS